MEGEKENLTLTVLSRVANFQKTKFGRRQRRRNRDAVGVERAGNGEGVSPPYPTRGSGERRELPQRGPGQSPGRKRIWGI